MARPTLDEVRVWVGGDAPNPSDTDALRLESAYDAAVEAVEGACMTDFVDGTETYPAGIREAIFLVAHRLVTRGSSPQGIGGFDVTGNVFRILTEDPDVKSAAGRYYDLTRLFA